MSETVDQLTEAVMDIAREQSHDDAALIIADRIRKHVTPYVTACENALTAFRYMRDVDAQAWDMHVTPEVCNAWDGLRAAIASAKA